MPRNTASHSSDALSPHTPTNRWTEVAGQAPGAGQAHGAGQPASDASPARIAAPTDSQAAAEATDPAELARRAQAVRQAAIEAFAASASWIYFYREILGVDGIARRLFNNLDELRFWETSAEFFEVQEMLTALRSNDPQKGEAAEPQRMITVRLPTSVHETLKAEAEEHQTSMNKLCLSKLMLSISDRFVPRESGRIRGRRPGPQGKRKQVTLPAEQSEEA